MGSLDAGLETKPPADLCDEAHPRQRAAHCVKPHGHTSGHAAPVAYRPDGRHGPEEWEWLEWAPGGVAAQAA